MARWSSSKWGKYRVLKKSPSLRDHLPETAWFGKITFWLLLNTYNDVIIKPSNSSGGDGVIRVKATGKQHFEVHEGARLKKVHGNNQLYAYLIKKIKRNYIVQRRIPLACVNNRPFDLRVMVQRRRKADWQITGTLAKVAGKGFIVTNMLRSHGYILPAKSAIKRSGITKSVKNTLSNIDRVAMLSAEQLRSYYPSVRTIGLDIGLDNKGHAWIIEANFAPMKFLFRHLKDKAMYRKIMSFHESQITQAFSEKNLVQL